MDYMGWTLLLAATWAGFAYVGYRIGYSKGLNGPHGRVVKPMNVGILVRPHSDADKYVKLYGLNSRPDGSMFIGGPLNGPEVS